MKLTAAVLALHAVTAAATFFNFKPGDPILTSSGLVHGHAAPNATNVSEYLGIPFAKPPTGQFRFVPPQKFVGIGDVNATKFPNSCPQSIQEVPKALPLVLYNLLNTIAGGGATYSEDCLYLNVWTKPQSGPHFKPVLVYIHGGGFNTGGSGVPAGSGQYFAADEDVVFVSINYRLNIFGFPGASYLTQNLGLLDQRAALEWVRINIAAFGGDPTRITIFGQSAGAASVDFFNFAWPQDPIIAGSILESGTAISFGNKLPATANNAWNTATTKLGCGNSTSSTPDKVLDCMRQPNITWQNVESAIRVGGLAGVLGSFGPTIDNKTVFQNYTEQTVKGLYAKRPILIGSNVAEAALFQLIALGAGSSLSQDAADAFTSTIFTCPASRVASLRQAAVPVTRYQYFPNFPNVNLPITNSSQAYHTAELFPLFGTDQEATQGASTADERTTGRYLRAAWSAFARNPASGLKNEVGWCGYDSGNVVMIGYQNRTNTVIDKPKEFVDSGKCNGQAGIPNT